MSSARPRIVTLLARHGDSKYRNALPDICKLFAHQLPEFAHSVVVIDNTLRLDHIERLAPGIELIGGDNAAWEFSAWDRGVAHVGPQLDELSFVHLATSAFNQLYTEYLGRFEGDMISLIAGRAAAIGHIDCFNEPVVFAGRSLQSWLRSSFIMLPPAEVRLLGSLVSVTDRDVLFSSDPAAPFRVDAPLSAAYRENILGWLTGEGTGQGTKWHSRFLLSEQTLPFFEAKTAAILNEQMLTSRLRAQGCATVDATWLASLAERGGPDGKRLRILPGWQVQKDWMRRLG